MNTEPWHRLFDRAVKDAERLAANPQHYPADAVRLARTVLALAEQYGTNEE